MLPGSAFRYEDETTVYTSCMCNCGSNHQCVFKARLKDGVVTRVEPDDRYNTGAGREDEVLSEEQLIKTHLQRRPCTKGLVSFKYMYHPDRILYPLKRAPGSRRGDGKYVRISWDEALDTIAGRMQECREKYGPYSIITPYMPNPNAERLFSLWGAGMVSWGSCSYDSIRMMAHIIAGAPGWEYPQFSSSSAADMLANARMIFIWGFDPAMGSSGPAHQFAWFLKLARERGKPVVIFDPRYTMSAQVLADQWIPIKPGTDTAMFMALANVLFRDDIWDKKFVERYVEPEGFQRYRDYVLGVEDGIDKTPEWAETKCAVPAETIRALARILETVRPVWLWNHWAVSRKSHGENTVRAFAALQAMLGYWGTPGGGPPLQLGPSLPVPNVALWGPNGSYRVPKPFRSHYWAQGVLLLEKVRSGELSEKDYMRMVGWRADPKILKDFNPRMLFWGGNAAHASDHLVTACESPNDQIKAIEKMEFTATMHNVLTPTARYADIILPSQDWQWEEQNIGRSQGYGGFQAVNYCPGVVKPPGEVKPFVWVYTKLAEKLGIDPKRYFRYYTTDENWDRDWETYMKDCYDTVVQYYRKRGITVPGWEEFRRGAFINCDELEEKPLTGWDAQIKEGKPFKTASGKIEFYSRYVADEANRGTGEHFDAAGQLYENLASDWGSLTPLAVWKNAVRLMNDPMAREYPLTLLAPHCRYRVHYAYWDNPWLRGQVYQHRVWLSTPDAEARGIRDGDPVKVYNDRGTVVMPAYVTSRMMPGIIAIHHGGRYLPDESGIDRGASPSTLLGGDFESCITPAKASSQVQVEKWESA